MCVMLVSPVIAVFNDSSINVEDVTFLGFAGRRNAVTHHVVHSGTDGMLECRAARCCAITKTRAESPLVSHDIIVTDGVQFQG